MARTIRQAGNPYEVFPEWPSRQLSLLARPEDLELAEAVLPLIHGLKAAREERGWSAAELAAVAGVSRTAIWNMETGRAWPDLATLGKVGVALGLRLVGSPASKGM